MIRKLKIVLLFLILIATAKSQQVLDSANVTYWDNTADGNTNGTNGTLMNDPHYREFMQWYPQPEVNGWWTSQGTSIYWGGNARRASRYSSGNNSGAHAHYYCNVATTDYYLVYHQMLAGNASTNCYVKFYRFGEGLPADSFRYNMTNNMVYYDFKPNGQYSEATRGSWYPIGIIQLFAADSSLTFEIGLDSLGSNALITDAVALVRSTATGPDLEFGNRRFSELQLNSATGDTIVNYSFYKNRAPINFPQTTFKHGSVSTKQLVLYNLGSADLVVSGFQTNTNRFYVSSSTPITIPPGGKQSINVIFAPKGEETTVDSLTILSNDPLEPQASIGLIGTGINYNFVLNASLTGGEPHWNVPPPGGIFELIGSSGWISSIPSPWQYPIVGGNIYSVVNTGTSNQIAAVYKFNMIDSLYGKYFLEYAGPLYSPNAAQNVTVDVVTPFYTNPNPALGDTQRVTGFNSRLVTLAQPWARIGGNTVFELNGGGQTVIRMTNPSQGGTELLRADLLRVRLVPIAPTISTSLDPGRNLTWSPVSIYDSIRQMEGNFQKNFIIASNGETPLRIDTIYFKGGSQYQFVNLPTFPRTLPAVDGQYNLLINFLPSEIRTFVDTVVIKSNDPRDSVIRVRLVGSGKGTGITADDGDASTWIFPSQVQNWTGTPDPQNMDKWYRVTGSGVNNTRLFHYIYFNTTGGPEKVEWYPYFPLKPGFTTNTVDSFDVYVNTAAGSSISTPRAVYYINHVGPKGRDTVVINQNATAYGGQVPASGRVFLGRYLFLRGGQDYHGGGTIFGSVELLNDTARVSAVYLDSAVNVARRDSFVIRADAITFEQAGITSVEAEPQMTPTEYSLSQNYPNPFNPSTKIRFSIPLDEKVELKIYDILGREVVTLMRENLKAGFYTVEWNGKNSFNEKVTSGIYLYRIVAGKFVQTRKMILMK